MGAIYDPSSPGRYFINRARRILPAYYAVLLVIVVVAIFLALPHEVADVRRHALYSTALLPNVGYWFDGSYFDKSAFRPALHLWSLGVEAQFYLIVPVIVALAARRPKLLALIGVASFVACVAIVGSRPRYAFYLLPFRLWEFLLGYYAFKIAQQWDLSQKQATPWFAAVLVLGIAAAIFVPIDEFSHPKYQAAAVTLVTATLLVIGLPAVAVSSAPGRFLVLVGKYSYSIYLVHFPLIVFWFYRPFNSMESFVTGPADIIGIIAATALISALLFHAVEVPLRKVARARPLLAVHAGLAAVTLAAVAIAKPVQSLIVPATVHQISAGWSDRGAERCGKFAILLTVWHKACALTAGSRRYLLVGNSHADGIKDAMAEVAAKHDAELWLFRENCVLGRDGCDTASIANFAADHAVGTIILHTSRGSTHVEHVRRLVEIGNTRGFAVVVIDPVPDWKGSPLKALYDVHRGLEWPAWYAQTIESYHAANAQYLTQTETISAPNFARYNPAGYLCNPDCRAVSPIGQPLYFDTNHLTKTGALQLSSMFHELFRARRAWSVSEPMKTIP